ncbi:MAG: hypothetical protein MZV65_15175 [Chromatiales bacterium]|nr:hypothetical protein [Chromatiales bacterium]
MQRRRPADRPIGRNLALGPDRCTIWPQREKLLDFYERSSAVPVDIVYLGETVCSKRHAPATPATGWSWPNG